MNPLELTCDQLIAHFQQQYGRGLYHAAALYRAFYVRPEIDPLDLPEFKGSLLLGRQIRQALRVHLPRIVRQIADEEATKLVLELHDGLEVEAVMLTMANRITVCISSQVGCRMGCRFCRTGHMGFKRNLSVAEIVAQVYLAKVMLGMEVRNVVFMGMGEPLDNFDTVVQAIEVLGDQRGLNISRRHITVSTAGLVDGIEKLAALHWPQLKLAVSLNAPDDELRPSLMPVANRFPLSALKQALMKIPLARGNALFIEYILIKGINDSPEHACALADYLIGLPAKVNLIPYNGHPDASFRSPDTGEIRLFLQALIDRKVFVRLRASKGARIQAACGQLGGIEPSVVSQDI